jgi:uncharacterized protein (DUF433 family)
MLIYVMASPQLEGKRIAVQTILEFLTAGDTPQEILEQYPSLEIADIYACLQFATDLMNRRYTIKNIEQYA